MFSFLSFTADKKQKLRCERSLQVGQWVEGMELIVGRLLWLPT